MDMSDEIDAVDETTFDGFPLVFARGGISAESKDVTTPVLLCFLCQWSESRRRN